MLYERDYLFEKLEFTNHYGLHQIGAHEQLICQGAQPASRCLS